MNETSHRPVKRRPKKAAESSVESRLSVESVSASGGGYDAFIQSKFIVAKPAGIAEPAGISERLFPFQQACVKWALQRGRCAIFAGTGLGKTGMQCDWSRIVELYTEKPVLILAPLAVSHQTISEAQKILGMEVKFAEYQANIGDRGVYITNWQKLERFNPETLGGVAGDETSIIKSQEGKTRQKFIDFIARVPFRLCCTATPAPNDYMELGSHCEALGIMKASEMLATFFVHDGSDTQKWRLKRHAEGAFWEWMVSWCVCFQKPSDIGFDDAGYVLPELRMHEHIVDTGAKPLPGELFAMPARTMQERRGARRDTIGERVAECSKIVGENPDDQWLVWCNLNAEAEGVAKAIKAENITGSDDDQRKEYLMLKFAAGEQQRITTKPSLAGFGMNWQKCHRMAFLGLSDSWEQMYQSIRRCWRYRQKHPVDAHIIISSLEVNVLQNIKRKEADAQRMQQALIGHMAELTKKEFGATGTSRLDYNPKTKMKLPKFL